MPERPVRWGVLGSSAYISGLVVPAIVSSPTGALAAVATRGDGTDATSRLAVEHGAALLPDYAAVVDSPDVDAVYVPLPNTLHVEWVLRAVEAGKHVLVEKPLAMTEAQVDKVLTAAADRGVVVMEAFMYRFHPQHALVHDLIAEGRIGEVRGVRASFAFRIDDPRNIRLSPELGGGATWDVGCYATDVAHWYLQDAPTTVRATARRRPGTDLDSTVAAVLEFPGDRFAVLDYSIDFGQQASYEVQGTAGSISVPNAWAMREDQATVVVRDQHGVRTETVVAPADHYRAEVVAFERAVLDGAASPYSATDSLRNAQTLERILAEVAP
ncbi:Gfo/Idh/MocA family protein [Cellulomonas sp. P5_C5]